MNDQDSTNSTTRGEGGQPEQREQRRGRLQEPLRVEWRSNTRDELHDEKRAEAEFRARVDDSASAGRLTERFVSTLERNTTLIVMETVAEAEAVATVARGLIGRSGPNGSRQMSGVRIYHDVRDGMAERGYVQGEDSEAGAVRFVPGEPDAEADRALRAPAPHGEVSHS